jgi:hypothetical protein
MALQIKSPGVVSLASSARGENSFALHGDHRVGVSTLDRFTAHTLRFLADAHRPDGNAASRSGLAGRPGGPGGLGGASGPVAAGGGSRGGGPVLGGEQAAGSRMPSGGSAAVAAAGGGGGARLAGSLAELYRSYQPHQLMSHAIIARHSFPRDLRKVTV